LATTTKNVLLIAPQWIGDAVMTEPLVRRLSERGERVTVGALPSVAAVYRAMPGVVQVIELPAQRGRLQLRERLRIAKEMRGQFAVAYVCPNSLKSALIPWLARIPQRVGYIGEMRWGLLTDHLINPDKDERPPMVEFYAALSLVGQTGEVLQSRVSGDLRPRFAMRPEVIEQALVELTHRPELPTMARHSFMVFAPGAEYGAAKRWPAEYFAAVAAAVDRPVLLLGGPKDVELCEHIATLANARNKGCCFNLAGQTTLEQAFALISLAYRVLTNDSGLMHVAAALSVPQVAVFGSSSPDHTPPLSEKARVLWLRLDPQYHPPLACAPCYERECPLGHMRCLIDLKPERVLALLR
jgi:heptosyltransferase II